MRDASGNCICKSGYERQNGECVLIVKKEDGKDFQKLYSERENRRSDKVTKNREIDIYNDWYRGDSDDSDEEMRRRLAQGLGEMEKTVEPQHVKEPEEPKEQKDEGAKKSQVSEETKWYVWHNCGDNVGWWCHLLLSKKTKDFLNEKNNRALVGPCESEKQARQAICGMMDKSTFYEKGQGGAGVDTGTIVKIGGKVYDVTPFVYWDSNTETYKCR
jgi:hypothetical protein